MKKLVRYIKESKIASKILFITFLIITSLFTIGYTSSEDYQFVIDDILFLFLFYSIFAMLFLIPAIVINQISKIYFESNRNMVSEKSWIITLLLNLFFGNFGAHRFYVGKKVTGILYLFTFGVFGIGYVYDLILLILVLFKDKPGATIVPKSFNIAKLNMEFESNKYYYGNQECVVLNTSENDFVTDNQPLIENDANISNSLILQTNEGTTVETLNDDCNEPISAPSLFTNDDEVISHKTDGFVDVAVKENENTETIISNTVKESCESKTQKSENNNEELKIARIELKNSLEKVLEKVTCDFADGLTSLLSLVEKTKDNESPKTQNKKLSTYSLYAIEDEKVESNEVLFTDVSIDGFEERSQVIPQITTESKQNICENKDNTLSKPKVEISFNFENSYRRNDFICNMKRYENKKCKECAYIPFMQYYPSYDCMNTQQKDYYFYWRSEIRRGVYPKTDLSYIFLYVYELLSGIGYKNSSAGYNMLLAVWENYRTEFPKLDRYLLSWSVDYTWLHNLGFAMPNWENISLPYDDAIKNIIIEKYLEKLPLKLPFVLIDSLCDYSLVRSKFYNDGHQLLLNEAIPRVVALADASLYKKTGKGIFATYGPVKSKKQAHYIYQGANCKNANQRTEISTKDYINSAKLRNYINELVRFAENTLRELYSCRGKLRGVELDSETAHLIQSFLKKEYSPKKADTPIKRTKVELDFDSIKDLRNQSDAVRDALEVSESPCENKELLTDLQAIKELFLQLPPYCRKVIDELEKNNWEIKYDYSTQASVEKINELSAKSVACDILVIENDFLILEDDYQDEFEYVYEHLNEFDETKKSDTSNTRFDISVLSAELQELLKSLTSVQTEIVYIILSKNDVDTLLDKIATEEMSMPEILIDEINDIASQYIGDILIDTFSDEICILEQYYSELKNAVKQEEL